MVNYGGDEVSALVLDFGSSSLRAGYAGDDTPKAVVPTSFGYLPLEGQITQQDVTMAEDAGHEEGAVSTTSNQKSKVYVGQHGPSLWRAGQEVQNPVSSVDGLIQDFDAAQPLISHALDDTLRCNPSEHPILVTEPPWNTAANRERMAEIMFEDFQVPAFYVANTGVLNAFAAGKGSALIIDIGHSVASVTPVVDGFVLRKGVAYSSLPQYVRQYAKHALVSPTPYRGAIELLPHQLIASRMPVEPNKPPRFNLREARATSTSGSWRAWAEEREVEEWIQSVAGVLDQGWNEQLANARPQRQYEFPTGFNSFFGGERFLVGEHFFLQSPNTANQSLPAPHSLPHLLGQCLNHCEFDLRTVLLQHVVLTGGGSLFAGLTERVGNELTRAFSHVKIHAPGNPAERRFGGWLGGSILASLGTFHQLWISREEWQEHGRPIVAQRCK